MMVLKEVGGVSLPCKRLPCRNRQSPGAARTSRGGREWLARHKMLLPPHKLCSCQCRSGLIALQPLCTLIGGTSRHMPW
jgi:hypothetical protein